MLQIETPPKNDLIGAKKQMIKRLVLDVLKPHVPTTIELADVLGSLPGVSGVNLSLYEVDQQTETIKATIVGEDIDYDLISSRIRDFGGVIHSVDEVVAGKMIVSEFETLQER